MPTKADRKRLDGALSAFHSTYAAPGNWGQERWHESLYPALTKPTRYGCIPNQFVGAAARDAVLFAGEVQREHVRSVKMLVGEGPGVLVLEHVSEAKENDSQGEGEAATAKPSGKDVNFMFPPPVRDSATGLLTHWNMDAASALCANALDARPGDHVLDMCAAPGGKSVVLAQAIFAPMHASSTAASTSGLGCLHSNEMDSTRNKRLTQNLKSYLPEPLFKSNAVQVLRLDGAEPRSVHQLPHGAGGYDRVLLDAPCSSERHIVHSHIRAQQGGRIAEEMASWRRGGSKAQSKIQVGLLNTALRAVKVGGRVVYSTCSIETGENDGVIEKVLLQLEKERKKGGIEGWDVKFEMGSLQRDGKEQGKGERDEALEALTEETKYGRIAVPDHPGGGRWGPLFFCVITKVERKEN